MKPFINNTLLALICAAIFMGCSAKEEDSKNTPETPRQSVVVDERMSTNNATLSVEEKAPESAEPVQSTKKTTVPVEKPAKTLYPNEVLIQVKNWDNKLKFLKTHFTQTSEYDGVSISQSQGTLWYDKDKNLLRLDTLNTDGEIEQTAITDKQKILILDGQGHEITTLNWQEWQKGQPNQALFDFGNYTTLLERHNAVLRQPYLLELTPKEGEPYTLYLTLSQEDYFPTNIKIVSDLMVTEAVLSTIEKNKPLAFNTFRAGGLFK